MVTFVVLVDFTDASDTALVYAQTLARYFISRRLRAELCLLAVLPAATDPAAPYFPHTTDLEPSRAVRRLQRQAARLPGDVPCRYDLIISPVAEELPERLTALNATVVVLGRGPAHHDTALYLVHLLALPLLVVPQALQLPLTAPARIVLDTDCQPVHLPRRARQVSQLVLALFGGEQVLYLGPGHRAAERLLDQLLPQAIGIHVYTAHEPPPPPKQLLARLSELGLLAPHAVQTSYHARVDEGIVELARDNGADLLLFVARQRSLPAEHFGASPPARLMRHCPLPMLVVPEAEPVPWTRCV